MGRSLASARDWPPFCSVSRPTLGVSRASRRRRSRCLRRLPAARHARPRVRLGADAPPPDAGPSLPTTAFPSSAGRLAVLRTAFAAPLRTPPSDRSLPPLIPNPHWTPPPFRLWWPCSRSPRSLSLSDYLPASPMTAHHRPILWSEGLGARPVLRTGRRALFRRTRLRHARLHEARFAVFDRVGAEHLQRGYSCASLRTVHAPFNAHGSPYVISAGWSRRSGGSLDTEQSFCVAPPAGSGSSTFGSAGPEHRGGDASRTVRSCRHTPRIHGR